MAQVNQSLIENKGTSNTSKIVFKKVPEVILEVSVEFLVNS